VGPRVTNAERIPVRGKLGQRNLQAAGSDGGLTEILNQGLVGGVSLEQVNRQSDTFGGGVQVPLDGLSARSGPYSGADRDGDEGLKERECE